MTPIEMEDAIKSCDRRLTAIEQILPTLATKQDLAEGLGGLETTLKTEISQSRTETRVLYEELKSHIEVLAEHLVRAIERWDRRR